MFRLAKKRERPSDATQTFHHNHQRALMNGSTLDECASRHEKGHYWRNEYQVKPLHTKGIWYAYGCGACGIWIIRDTQCEDPRTKLVTKRQRTAEDELRNEKVRREILKYRKQNG